MIVDYALWFGSVWAVATIRNNGIFFGLPIYAQNLITLAFWGWAGFIMWAIFITGHDCGHGTFSEYQLVNDFVGHLSHGSICVPFWPWRLSHQRHHMYHNHLDKDYSHPWYTPEKLERPDHALPRMMENYPHMRFIFPFLGWFLYLYGMPDGSHFVPFAEQRLWKGSPTSEYLKCLFSSASVGLTLWCVYQLCGGDLGACVYYYGVPLGVMGWWLVCVTYLQHHNPETLVYDDDDWKFVPAAFETVDREFGFGIDAMHHHITDGHVAHHLFFTKIPHYNLPMATKAIKEYLNANGLGSLYKFDKTHDFAWRLHKYMVDFGFRSTLYDGAEGAKKAN